MGFIGLEDTEILDDEAVEENIDEVKDYGARLKDFRLRLGDYDPRDLSPSPWLGELNELNIDWDKLFVYMPGLKRLGLTKVPLLSCHIPRTLKAYSDFVEPPDEWNEVPGFGERSQDAYAVFNAFSTLKDLSIDINHYVHDETSDRSRIQTTLHVINPGKCTRNGVRRNELAPLLEQVKQKHPSLALAMRITGRHGNMFDRIATLALDWRPRYRGQPLFYDMNGSEDAAFEMGSDVSIYSLSGSEYYSMSDEEGAAMDED
ncbi:uncharacterized protein PITG_02223 [Phytophthora infestans T30-4]|uniref:Uncharacterized protein n=1 Tax=Phytophthora infestans (strain T30-4) TaxID=403677 RepID=D0MVS7_PHYIT|nr:uncharacterized protein PITG_02223 [Phytophthora infestans T30-4]EEY63740.1 conserved hypothetical protein [Phytophthora infestans T30-4]|eukprot:XP_002907176.1 conserved hypothetical protein [Phytophthora infestans T30-4]